MKINTWKQIVSEILNSYTYMFYIIEIPNLYLTEVSHMHNIWIFAPGIFELACMLLLNIKHDFNSEKSKKSRLFIITFN